MSKKMKYFYLIGEITEKTVQDLIKLVIELNNEPETGLCIFIDTITKSVRDIRLDYQ